VSNIVVRPTVLTLLLALHVGLASPAVSDPFAFFEPSVVITVDDRRQLDRGESIARILQGAPIGPEVVVAGEEIFTTRYVNASVGMTTLIGDEPGHRHYVTYLNRSDVSVLGGPFGGIVRWIVQRRVKAEAGDVLLGLKQRLEGGDPNRPATGKSP
jgi:hypothetical protein